MTDFDHNTKIYKNDCITEYNGKSAIGIKCVITTEEAHAIQQAHYMAEATLIKNQKEWSEEQKQHQEHILRQLQLVLDKLTGAFLGSYFKDGEQ
tara:strand:+ start:2146 stop:2427 length:282 start_codon:yes stop_codon:yes gene_type:complete